MKSAVVLIAHGTVGSLDDLPEFLKNIRRGHDAPPELLAEVRRRYEAIGGQSPLLEHTRSVAKKLAARLDMPVEIAMRLFHPYPKPVIQKLYDQGVRRIIGVPLAQHSAPIYGAALTAAAKDISEQHPDSPIEVVNAPNWGQTKELTGAFADEVVKALHRFSSDKPADVLLLTAHSLPVAIIRGGDPYEKELRASAEAVAAEAKARGGRFGSHRVAFQSQGIGTGMEWLGPGLESTLKELAAAGAKNVVVAPIGFLADHVEILYDLDIEAKAWADGLGMNLYRSASLNDGEGMVAALEAVVRGMTQSG